MSEYQYYEFRAIDRALTSREMDALRSISSRARITPKSFVNSYDWGDLKANPKDLMISYFDAHFYAANWGSGVFMLRVPKDAVPDSVTKGILISDSLSAFKTEEFLLLCWSIEGDGNLDLAYDEEGDWMQRLMPLRSELLRGDFRSLYVGWLAGVSEGFADDDECEPFVPIGLGELTSAQEALVEFLNIDPDLLAGAAEGSPALQSREPSPAEMDLWLSELPQSEVMTILKLLLSGAGMKAERSLFSKFQNWRQSLESHEETVALRSVDELLRRAEVERKERLKKERLRREKAEEAKRRAREAYLKTLAAGFPKAWADAEQEILLRTASAYDRCLSKIRDLSASYSMFAEEDQFTEALERFMIPHMKKQTFVRRLIEAGLWRAGKAGPGCRVLQFE